MILNFFKGLLIGIGGIIPGLSGAVIAMIFGLYSEMIHSVSTFFKDIKKNFIFLFPILCGIAAGFILFSNIQKLLLDKYPFQTMMVIVGLIIGTVPVLVKDAKIQKLDFNLIVIFIITLVIGLLMSYIAEPQIDIQNRKLEFNYLNIMNLILIGFIMAGSHIIPGISGTVILMALGSYGIMLNAVANLKDLILIKSYTQNIEVVIYNLFVILPIGIGLILGAILFSKLMDFLLKKYYIYTYCGIIGFVIGSIPSIVPDLSLDLKSMVGFMFLLVSVVISYKVSLLES